MLKEDGKTALPNPTNGSGSLGAGRRADTLVGCCERGDLQISNSLAENAIRPFALGRRAWLFADTTRGVNASYTCYSLIETVRADNLELSAYIHHILKHIDEADTVENLEALLP